MLAAWMPWIRGAVYALLVATTWQVQEWRHGSFDRNRIEAKHDAFVTKVQTDRTAWIADAALVTGITTGTATTKTTIDDTARAAATEIHHAPLDPVDPAAACPDWYGPEWERLYNGEGGPGERADPAPAPETGLVHGSVAGGPDHDG